jgi:hypothetical protein
MGSGTLMPARSEAQRRLIYARFGAEFAKKHHFDNPGKLPARAKKRRVTKGKTRHPLTRSMIEKGQM